MCQATNAYSLFSLTPFSSQFFQPLPTPAQMSACVLGSLFEKGYLLLTLRAILLEPNIAQAKLVANCWDAGVAAVRITDTGATDVDLRVRDDGVTIHSGKTEKHPEWVANTKGAFKGMARSA